MLVMFSITFHNYNKYTALKNQGGACQGQKNNDKFTNLFYNFYVKRLKRSKGQVELRCVMYSLFTTGFIAGGNGITQKPKFAQYPYSFTHGKETTCRHKGHRVYELFHLRK